MNTESWALAGVAIGGILTMFNTYLTSQREKSEIIRKETLAGLLSIHDGLSETHRVYAALANQALDSVNKREVQPMKDPGYSPHLSRLSFSVLLYAPDLASDFDSLKESQNRFMGFWTKNVTSISSGSINHYLAVEIYSELQKHEKAVSLFQSKLAVYARRKLNKSTDLDFFTVV
jgi:hypothetical protein